MMFGPAGCSIATRRRKETLPAAVVVPLWATRPTHPGKDPPASDAPGRTDTPGASCGSASPLDLPHADRGTHRPRPAPPSRPVFFFGNNGEKFATLTIRSAPLAPQRSTPLPRLTSPRHPPGIHKQKKVSPLAGLPTAAPSPTVARDPRSPRMPRAGVRRVNPPTDTHASAHPRRRPAAATAAHLLHQPQHRPRVRRQPMLYQVLRHRFDQRRLMPHRLGHQRHNVRPRTGQHITPRVGFYTECVGYCATHF